MPVKDHELEVQTLIAKHKEILDQDRVKNETLRHQFNGAQSLVFELQDKLAEALRLKQEFELELDKVKTELDLVLEDYLNI